LTKTEQRELTGLLRKRVRIYQIAISTRTTTATERKKALSKIKTAANRFLANPSPTWSERLLNNLEAADSNTRAVIFRELHRLKFEWKSLVATKRQLRSLIFVAGWPSGAQLDRATRFVVECAPVVRALAAMDVSILVPGKGKWTNPAQANLVAALQPIWCRVTGRTAGLTAANLEGDKRCRYAEWLRELLAELDLPAPPTGMVVDVVRSEN
jgi:hypothetical protein